MKTTVFVQECYTFLDDDNNRNNINNNDNNKE